MGKRLILNNISKWSQFFLILAITGAVLIPPINIKSDLPSVEVSDIVFPIFIFFLFVFYRKELVLFFNTYRLLVLSFLIFISFTVFSIIWNNRILIIRDWFEVLKYTKFITFIISVYIILGRDQIIRIISFLFVAVFIFNLFHYFNILNFNSIIEPFYAFDHHLDFFGLNSIGEPSTKRALGTLGNPNNNAIMFLFFMVIFLPKKNNPSSLKLIFLALSIIGVFMCQSRTGFVTLAFLLIIYIITTNVNWKISFGIILFSVFNYFLFSIQGNTYIDSLFSFENNVIVDSLEDLNKSDDFNFSNNSGKGRLHQWGKIIHSMPGYWVFGHGPNKEYFEKHSIYSESEYMLILFRYGIAGITSFMLFWFFWLRNYAIPLGKYFNIALYTGAIYLLTALTNNPLQSPKLMLILGLLMAFALLEIHEHKKEA